MDSFLKVVVGILLTLALILLSGVGYFFLQETTTHHIKAIQKSPEKPAVENPVKKSTTDNQEAIEKSYTDRQERIEALKEVGRELSGN